MCRHRRSLFSLQPKYHKQLVQKDLWARQLMKRELSIMMD